jgi:hypothetical protein
VDIAEIHFSSRARCASTAVPTPTLLAADAVTGGNDIPEGLTGERASDAPDVVDIAGLSTRKNEGWPSLPELFPLIAESSLTRGRTLGRTSSKSVSLTCTVSGSCKPSSSRADLARSADKEIFERSEPLLPKAGALGADVDAGKGIGIRKSEERERGLEPSTSIAVEPLCRGESEDCRRGRDRKNADSFPEAVRLDSAWLSLAEIRIDGGEFIIAAFGNEAGTRLDAAPSSFETVDCGVDAGAGTGAGTGPPRS